MKKILSLALMLLALQAAAKPSYYPENTAVMTTFAPSILVDSTVRCLNGANVDVCLISAAMAPIVSTTLMLSIVAILKEEIHHVEQDGLDYLAGAPKTLALEDLIARVRAQDESLNELPDQDIVALMLASVQ